MLAAWLLIYIESAVSMRREVAQMQGHKKVTDNCNTTLEYLNPLTQEARTRTTPPDYIRSGKKFFDYIATLMEDN